MFSNLYVPFEFMSLDVGLEFHDIPYQWIFDSKTISYKYGMNYFGVWVYYVISSYNIYAAINQYRY